MKLTTLATKIRRLCLEEAILLNGAPPCVQPPTVTISFRCGKRFLRSRNRPNPSCTSSKSGLIDISSDVSSFTPTKVYATCVHRSPGMSSICFGFPDGGFQITDQIVKVVLIDLRTTALLTARVQPDDFQPIESVLRHELHHTFDELLATYAQCGHLAKPLAPMVPAADGHMQLQVRKALLQIDEASESVLHDIDLALECRQYVLLAVHADEVVHHVRAEVAGNVLDPCIDRVGDYSSVSSPISLAFERHSIRSAFSGQSQTFSAVWKTVPGLQPEQSISDSSSRSGLAGAGCGSRSSTESSGSGGRIVAGLRVVVRVVVREVVVLRVVVLGAAVVVVGLGRYVVYAKNPVALVYGPGSPPPASLLMYDPSVGLVVLALSKNVSLSPKLPPRSAAPGYSQSRSNPSKLYTFMNCTTLSMNDRRRSFCATICEYFLPPSAHPPTAIWYLACGYRCRSSVKLRNPVCSRSTSGSITSTW
uniref:Uncharacterized protein n=1 Tax=Anopheles atroparvus TaxID=41427 RepID=A0A182IZI7_ANOAO